MKRKWLLLESPVVVEQLWLQWLCLLYQRQLALLVSLGHPPELRQLECRQL
jgi:hypothetical protein